MPLYEYRCSECGVRFERRQKFSDEPISVCPECNGPVHRVIGHPGIIFKGKGFYVTDNRRSGKRLPDTSSPTTSDKTKTTKTKEKSKGGAAQTSKSSEGGKK